MSNLLEGFGKTFIFTAVADVSRASAKSRFQLFSFILWDEIVKLSQHAHVL